MSKCFAVLAIALVNAALLPAQLTFEVVSVRPNPVPAGRTVFQGFGKQRPGVGLSGNKFTERQTTLQYLIMRAYGVWDYEISGMPDWARSPAGEHYEVIATVEGEKTPSPEQLRLMLQALLADRFHLKVHTQKKDLAVYALGVGKSGSKLRETTDGVTIQSMINLIANVMEYPIIDKTFLTGLYDFGPVTALNWRQFGEEHRADPMSHPDGLISAIEDQLGLKLELRKEPVDMIVVDSVEKPTPN